MDLESIEGLNEIRPSVYRVAVKILSLQKLCHMDAIGVRHIMAAFRSVPQDVRLNRQEVTCSLNKMFHSSSQEVPGHVTVEAPEETSSLMFRLYDRAQTGSIPAGSLQTALIVLSTETLLLKYKALLRVIQSSSGSVSRSGLRSLLQDVSQLPAAVQEEGVFGGVEAAVRSCFSGVLTPTAGGEHVLSWLQSEPRLLLWIPTLYRLSVSQNISHSVRCHTCKTAPITGLRYRCMKCVRVHLCQSCFLTDRQTKKHKPHHPVLEFCTQPTWMESLSSLVHSARHILLPRRYTQREAARKRALMWAESGETQHSAPPPSDPPSPSVALAVTHSPSSVSHDASVRPPSCLLYSKALQTDDDTPTHQEEEEEEEEAEEEAAEEEAEEEEEEEAAEEEVAAASALLTEVRNLQRDKWLLEQQLQAWRLTVQSEHSVLEDRCSQMEVTMETLREHHLHVQSVLSQAVNKMETQQHAYDTPPSAEITERETVTASPDTERNTEEEDEEEELLKTEYEWSDDQRLTPSPTTHQDTPASHDFYSEEEPADRRFLCCPIRQQEDDACVSDGEEDCGTCSPEELLQETVDKLKIEMGTDRWTERNTGARKGAELVEAADQVGDSIHHLVDAVTTTTMTVSR